jgi:protein TonB
MMAMRREVKHVGGSTRFRLEPLAGVLFVLVLHAAALYSLWSHRLIPSPQDSVTLFVNFIIPPAPPKLEQAARPPAKPQPIQRPEPRQLVTETPVPAPTDYVAPAPPPKPGPAIEAPSVQAVEAPPAPKPAGPVTLATELSVACPERTPPAYPSLSRRHNDEGTVTLTVELNENGQVVSARVNTSSGYPRLDEAALAAVRSWRCNPATRNGQPVRAVALQPFRFVLQGY